MNCREFVEFLMDYLDGELPVAQVTTFRQHMGDCPACERYLESYQETIRLGRKVCAEPEDELPEDVPEELVAAIVAARRTGR